MHADTPIRIRASVLAAGAFGLLGSMLELFFHVGWWLVPASMLLGALIGQVVYGASHGAATGLVRALQAGGGIDAGPGFSEEDALIMQGRHTDAAAQFRAWLTAHPRDSEASLRLAALLSTYLGEHDEAARLLTAVRDGDASPRQEAAARQALIDLYGRTRARGRQMAELARFADRYPGTPAADAARETLRRMKDAGNA